MIGQWLNGEEGVGWNLFYKDVERWGWFWTKTIYEFDLLYPNPLTWQDDDGYWQPDRHESDQDLGSIPPPLRGLFAHDRFIREYIMHDSACKHGGLWWTADPVRTPFGFRPIKRIDADKLLRRQIEIAGGKYAQWAIYAGVRIGACFRK